MHGYDTYDYGARGYYPAMGRFTSMDPLAEKYYSISPYAYCAGNPVSNIDPFGLDVWTTSNPEIIRQFIASCKSKSGSFVVKGDGWSHFTDKQVLGDKDTRGLLTTDTNHKGFTMQYVTYSGSLKEMSFNATFHLIRFSNILAKTDPDSHFGLDNTYNLYTTNEDKKAFRFSMNVALTLLLGPAVESLGLGAVTASSLPKAANIALKAAIKAPAAANALKNLGGSAMIYLTQKTFQATAGAAVAGAVEGTVKSIYGPDPESSSSMFMNPASNFGMNAAQGIWNGWTVLKGSNPLPNP